MVTDMIDIDEEMAKIGADEAAVVFSRFDTGTAWLLGCWLRDAGMARGLAIAVDVFANGMTMFQAALPGAKPDNAEWIRRKRNLALRMHISTRVTELRLLRGGTTLEARTGAAHQDFAATGGSVPIRVAGSGVIGAVTVSGLTGEADHALAMEALIAISSGSPQRPSG